MPGDNVQLCFNLQEVQKTFLEISIQNSGNSEKGG